MLGARRKGASSIEAIALLAVVLTALLALSAAPASAASPNLCPLGSGAGRCNLPESVAVDQSTGDLYLTEYNNARVDEFDSSGHFLRAFGYGVAGGGEEFETCITVCTEAKGFLFLPRSVGVDNSAGPSAGDLYVYDQATRTVEKYGFEPLSGKFAMLLSFAGEGSGAGELIGSIHPIAVDSSGHVWVGDRERVVEFGEGGEFLSEVALPPVGEADEVGALAVDASGDVYVINESEFEQVAPGAREYGPTGTLLQSFDEAGHPNALALDPSGNLFVSDQAEPGTGETAGTATLREYDDSGSLIEAFGSGEVLGAPRHNALAFATTVARIYVASNAGQEKSALQAFAVPPPGPLPVAGTTEASMITKTSASLCAEVNPEGAETTAHFEYITLSAFEADGGQFGAGTILTPESAPTSSDFEPHQLCQAISPLTPATAYRFRVRAANPEAPAGITGETAGFESLPSAAILSAGASAVTADSATLEAEINPLGDATTYHFEYLTQADYEANLAEGIDGFSGAHGATSVPLPAASIGAGESPVLVSQHLQGLSVSTVYRYRVVVSNAVSEANGGPFAGPTHALTTQAFLAVGLPDGRVWEQVSPPDKRGGALVGISEKNLIQASATGDAITYLSSAPTQPSPEGNSGITQILSARGAGGWSSVDLNPPHEEPSGAAAPHDYSFFSTDLSHALLEPVGPFLTQLSPAASEETPYLRDDFAAAGGFCTTGCDRPIFTGCPAVGEPCAPAIAAAADVPPGTIFARQGHCPPNEVCSPLFVPEEKGYRGATPDLTHLFYDSRVALTSTPLPLESFGMYEWSPAASPAEQIRLVSALPGGEAASNGAPILGGAARGQIDSNTRNAASADGNRVIWSTEGGEHHLYLRYNALAAPSGVVGTAVDGGQCSEPAGACSVQIDEVQPGSGGASEAPGAEFQTASVDGTRVFFTDSQQLTPGSSSGEDLYEYDLDKPLGERLTDITPEAFGEPAAIQGYVPGASEDGSWIYFVANGRLTGAGNSRGENPVSGNCEEPTVGEPGTGLCNLYVYHEGETRFLAVLSGADAPDWANGRQELNQLTARVSPSGRWLAFMSQRSLTGYDNRDASSGRPDEEVYLFHAVPGGEGTLVCASCNPTGARPHGIEYETGNSGSNLVLAGGDRVWGHVWLAANIPGWTPYQTSQASYQSRYLSNSGRLFFNSSDALSPTDSNGAEDIYEYEPPQGPEGPDHDSCTSGAGTYVAGAGGCISLISSGTSGEESAFLDASESGDDVFFLTSARLAKTDTDTSLDVYDARVDGGFPESAAPVECSGDACQQPATPPNDATPGSLTFGGAGNVIECPKVKVKQNGKCVKKKQKKAKKHKKKHHKGNRSNKKTDGNKSQKSKRTSSDRGGQK
jgi:hypothetical protein